MASKYLTKFSPHLKEIRIHLCQTSTSSKGLRDFIKNNYQTIKDSNPTLPILIRECSNIEPTIFVRYEFGKEKSATVSNYDENNIMKAIGNMTAS